MVEKEDLETKIKEQKMKNRNYVRNSRAKKKKNETSQQDQHNNKR